MGVCEQLQLQQCDGSAPLTSDIESDEVSVRVTTTYAGDAKRPWEMPPSTSSTWNLTVPASGIMTLTMPADPDANSITMTVRRVLTLPQTALVM